MTEHSDSLGLVKKVTLHSTISPWDSLSHNARTLHRLKKRVVYSGKKSPAKSMNHDGKIST